MNKKYGVLIKDTVIFALGNFGTKIILFLLVPLYTSYLSTEEYGISEFVFTMSQLLYPVVSLCIYEGVIRIGLKKGVQKENTLLGALVIWIGSCALLLATTPLWTMYETISEWKWYLSIYTSLHILVSIELNYLKVKEKNGLFSLACVVQTLTLGILNIILLACLHEGIQGYLLANCGALFLSVVFVWVIGRFDKDLLVAKLDKNVILEMLLFSIPLIINNISWWIINSSDKIMIQAMLSAAELGLYTVATKIPSLINVFTNIFSQAWSISSIKEIESSNDNVFYSTVFKAYTTLVFAAGIFVIAIVKPFMAVYVSYEFVRAWVFVPLLLVSAVFSSIAAYFSSLMGALQISKKTMQTTLFGATVNVFLNYIGIKLIGIWGAIVGTVVAYAVILLSRAYITLKHINIKINVFKVVINTSILLLQATLISLDVARIFVSVIAAFVFIIINSDDLKNILHFGKNLLESIKNRRK